MQLVDWIRQCPSIIESLIIYILLGLGVSNVGLPGMIPCSSARIVFRSPEIPAPGSECPMLLLTYRSFGELRDF